MLKAIPRHANPDVLVGFDTSDDAGVFRLSPSLALVQTVDFFTPIVDDPFTYGAIAAANSLSDVYAMGGTPVSALSILAWPASGDLTDLEAILQGGAAKLAEAGTALLGGHSVSDDEIKFGYSVTGTIHPDRILMNAGACEGDVLVLSKPLGTGIVATALKRGIASSADADAARDSMLRLNLDACSEMLSLNAHACTDVTGFGLLGHAREMALASGVILEIDVSAIEALPGALHYAKEGALPGGLTRNRTFVSPSVEGHAEAALDALLYDPQTSGGLLIALPAGNASRFMNGRPIGRVLAGGSLTAKAIRLV